MSSFHDIPDELLATILNFSCIRDFEGLTARNIYAVCKRWNRIITPTLYRNLAVLPPSISYRRGLFPSLLETLDDFHGPLNVQNLILRVYPRHSGEIFNPLAQLTHTTLVSLTISLQGSMYSLESLLRSVPSWPVLTHLTIIGDTAGTVYGYFARALPALTDIHIIGSCVWPKFEQIPECHHPLHTFRVSMIRYFASYERILVYLHRALHEAEVQYAAGNFSSWPGRVKVWEINYQGDAKRDAFVMEPSEERSRLWTVHEEKVKVKCQEISLMLSRMPNAPEVRLLPIYGVPEDVWRSAVGSSKMWDRVLGMLTLE
ncbi:hypothetical protein DL96DRAFT_1716790 [Flagelloscypha sp. PMI_526]|nr:hypothetical protein DL96DRAFT_1716790 [Flagelloscypha sp. PMI_526]